MPKSKIEQCAVKR